MSSGPLRVPRLLSSAPCRKLLAEYLSADGRSARYASTARTRKFPEPARKGASYYRGQATASDGEANVATPRSPNYGKLKPYQLALRLAKLSEKGQLDEAIETLQSMPLKAQNVKVWNTLISSTMDAKKYKRAFSLYVELRRRGFKPSLRTHTTMLSGYLQIEDWSQMTSQLSHVHQIYDSLLEFLEGEQLDFYVGQPERNREMRIALTMYFDIVHKAGQHGRIIDAFKDLPVRARDGRMYGVFFRAINMQSPSGPDAAAQVREVWEEFCQLQEGDPKKFQLSDLLCYYVFTALVNSTDVADHALAFDIAREKLGLRFAAYSRPPVEPHPKTVTQVLKSAALLGHYDILRAYADVVMHRDALRPTLSLPNLYTVLTVDPKEPLDARTVANLIELIAGDRPADIARASVAVEHALEACWRGRNFSAAARVLAAYQLVDAHELTSPPAPRRAGALQPHEVSSAMWTQVMRAALATENKTGSARECLRILEARGPELLKSATVLRKDIPPGVSVRIPPLVRALAEAALAEDEELDSETRARWQKVRNGAQSVQGVLRRGKQGTEESEPTPEEENAGKADALELV